VVGDGLVDKTGIEQGLVDKGSRSHTVRIAGDGGRGTVGSPGELGPGHVGL